MADAAPTHIRKCYPKCLSTTHPGAHTPAGSHTRTVRLAQTHSVSTDTCKYWQTHIGLLRDRTRTYTTNISGHRDSQMTRKTHGTQFQSSLSSVC